MRTWAVTHNRVFSILYTGTAKRHNVCKSHAAIDTGFKQNELTIFLHFFSLSHKTLTRTNISVTSVISVLLHNNTVTNVNQICRWSAIFFSLITRISYCITCMIIRLMLWLFCLKPVTTCWCESTIKWRHNCTSAQRTDIHGVKRDLKENTDVHRNSSTQSSMQTQRCQGIKAPYLCCSVRYFPTTVVEN